MKSRKSVLNNQVAKLLAIVLIIQSLATFATPIFAETSKTKSNLQNQKRQKSTKSKQHTKGYRLIIIDYRGKPLISLETQQSTFPQLAASINFTYNQAGFRATMTDASGTTTYNYDTQNRLISKQTPQGTLNYTYDLVGRVTSVRSSNANGVDLSYTYNENGLLISVVDNRLPSGSNTTTYTYHTTKVLESTTLPNGVKTGYGFDSQDRLTSVTVTKNAVSLASYNYTLGPSGNRLPVQELNGRTVSYTYDSVYQLKSETINSSPNATQINFIDPSGNSAVNVLAVITVASIIVNIASAVYHLNNAYYEKDPFKRNLEVTYACMDLLAATLAVFGGSIIGPGSSFAFASGATVTSNGLKLTATSIAIPAITNIFAVRSYPDGSYRSEDGKFHSRTREPAPGTAKAKAKAKAFVQQLRNNGFDVVAEEASVETPLGLRRFDAVIRAADGKLHGLEIKSGTATKGQFQTFIDTFIVNKGGAPGVGKIEGETVHSATTVYIP